MNAIHSLAGASALLLFSTSSGAHPTTDNGADQRAIERVQIVASRKGAYTEITEDTQKLIELPGSLGDPIGAITALPGVIMPSGGSEPAVRGSSPDDNRYYIDGLPAGYIFHEFNTSILDQQTIQDFQLYTAGFGAQYSGATGAVFDIRLRDPKQQPLSFTASASLLRTSVFVEGQVTEKSSFYLSTRLGLAQFFMPDEEEEHDDDGVRIKSAPEDHDYLFKYKWDMNDNNSLLLTALGAGDFAEANFNEQADFAGANPDFAGDASVDEDFASQGLSWYHYFPAGGQFKLLLATFEEKSQLSWGDNYFEDVRLAQQQVRAELQLPVGTQHSVTLGTEGTRSDFDYNARTVLFVCTEFDVDCQSGRRDIIEPSNALENTEYALYLIDHWQINEALSLETGIQFHHDDYLDENVINPRMAMTWYFLPNVALTSSAGRYNRFADLETVLPELGNPRLDSPKATHYTFGFKGDINDIYNWSAESYYKKLTDLPLALGENEPNAELRYTNQTEGTASGIDILLNRREQDGWYGWASLSYSKSDRTNLRTGETLDYRLDTPLVFNLVGNMQLTENWTAGFRFIVKSGEATTRIVGIQANPLSAGDYLPVYGDAFDDRLPVYTRLDLRAQRPLTLFGYDAKFFIDILNALNRKNITERNLDYEKVAATQTLHIEEEEDFGLFPSIGIEVTF